MADVRFLILCGPPSLDPSTVGYPPAESAAEPDGGADGWWYAWRLMASNNRRLARGVTSFTSRQFVVDEITRLRGTLTNLEPLVLTDPRNGSWGWHAEHEGVRVVLCPHSYERERDCRGGFRRFVDAVPKAQVAEGGIILRDHRSLVPAAAQSKEQGRWPAH